MPNDRFFIHDIFENEKKLSIDGDELFHLKKVMRKRINESIELINGKNQLAKAHIVEFSDKKAIVKIDEIFEKEKSKFEIILCQALCKQNRIENILEKATELGVSSFILFHSKLSEKIELSDNRKNRFNHIILSAVKQCARLDIPKIEVLKDLSSFNIKNKSNCFFGDINEKAPLFIKENIETTNSKIMMFIGPEKGFTEEEIKFLENSYNAKGIKLHDNILRTDTAAIFATGLIYQKLYFDGFSG